MVKVKLIIKVGEYIYPNGDKYDGEWKDGKMDGEGNEVCNI